MRLQDQECVRLSMSPLADAIRNHAQLWIDAYGQVLLEASTRALKTLKEELEVCSRRNAPDDKLFSVLNH